MPRVTKEHLSWAERLWDFHRLGHPLRKADAIVVFCSHDLRVAVYAASLWKEGYGPWLVFSGGIAHSGDLLDPGWDRPEAEVFAEKAREKGIPENVILTETRATNTGENIRYTKALLHRQHLAVSRLLMVQKPYMERRTLAALRRQWPEPSITLTSPPLSFAAYISGEITPETVIMLMVGDLQRLMVYAARGYQEPQEIPEEVMEAYHGLIHAGYTSRLIEK